MTQTSIPFLLMRGGTSRGPYFRAQDLPNDRETLSAVLIAAVGSGQTLNIDGVGGGNAVTTKVAMLSRSADPWADIDYFFAQVSVEDRTVDYQPTCGNILTGVGPAALEMGLIKADGDESEVRIRAANTGARIVARVQTPGGAVTYDGTARIDGVPGTAAPVALQFMDTVGGSTGAFLPTGRLRDVCDGIEVTCMDVAVPMVIARADSFGLTGYEGVAALGENRAFLDAMEAVRCKAGLAMGMGDVSGSVTPRFAILAPAKHGGTVAARHFMPWAPHPSMAVTGAQCIASCVLTPGTVAAGLSDASHGNPARITIEHANGDLDVLIDYTRAGNSIRLNSAALVRTARLLVRGEVMVPRAVWSGH